MLPLIVIVLTGLLTTQGSGVHASFDPELMAEKAYPALIKFLPPQKPCAKCPDFSYDAVYDLEKNKYTTNEYITEHLALSEAGCSTRGTLKIALASAETDPNRRRVLIDLFFDNPTGFTFNLGDSSSNNGYAGDSGTQTWDAEVQGNGATFAGYLSDEGRSGQAFAIGNFIDKRLTLIVGDGHIVWMHNNNNMFNYYYNKYFFGLNGQADGSGPVNYDLYLGLNQVVVGGNFRVGSGLCKVGIKFLPEF